MAIFVVFRVYNPEKMAAAMRAAFPEDHYQLQHDEWLVSSQGTVQDISDKLGVTPEPASGVAMIFRMASYYGRAPTDIWDWIKAKAETSGG